MSQYLVEIPIVGYVSVVVDADNMEEAVDKGIELASECHYKTDGQEATLVIEELDVVEDLINYTPTRTYSSTQRLYEN